MVEELPLSVAMSLKSNFKCGRFITLTRHLPDSAKKRQVNIGNSD